MNRLLQSVLARLPGFHPAVYDLLEWVGAETHPLSQDATGSSHRKIALHLVRCERCRDTAARLRVAIAVPAESHASESLARERCIEDVFERLQARMQAWNSLSGVATAPRVLPVRTRAVHRQYRALELYFGRGTAERIAHSGRRGTYRHLLPAAEPLFHAFLGRRAAEALTRQIADTAA